MENITDENIHRLVEEYLSNSENELPRIGGWDVSNVTNMNSLFSKYKDFNEDLSRWNVCTVERMDGMFFGCTNFVGEWLYSWGDKVGNVITMENMFSDCVNFNQNLGNWNVSNVETMECMFYRCTNFTGEGLDTWGDKVSKVINMSNMFSECLSFNQNLCNWNVSNVTHMTWMFEKCKKFKGDGLGEWGDKVINVIEMSFMFSRCTILNVNISGWALNPYLIGMGMFEQCMIIPYDCRVVIVPKNSETIALRGITKSKVPGVFYEGFSCSCSSRILGR